MTKRTKLYNSTGTGKRARTRNENGNFQSKTASMSFQKNWKKPPTHCKQIKGTGLKSTPSQLSSTRQNTTGPPAYDKSTRPTKIRGGMARKSRAIERGVPKQGGGRKEGPGKSGAIKKKGAKTVKKGKRLTGKGAKRTLRSALSPFPQSPGG